MIYALTRGSLESKIISTTLQLTSFAVALGIVIRPGVAAFKIVWVLLIFLSPILGGAMFLFFNYQPFPKAWKERIKKANKKGCEALLSLPDSYDKARAEVPDRIRGIRYLKECGKFPVYSGTEALYLPLGENKWEALLPELQGAKKYIFIEYFIIQEGVFWDSILEILKKKAAEGVLVRVLYDDIGCFLRLPKDYSEKLREYGIECAVFNRFVPFITTMQNNRDHRKILSIDGRVCFTGGINLADEYVNKKALFGHWKDSAVMLRGDAAWSMTVFFLKMWETTTGKDENYLDFLPGRQSSKVPGFVQPYSDSPLDDEPVSAQLYLQLINEAKDYLYISTPYLIIDDSFISALSLAAKSGVDVRIVTPGVADKLLVHLTTRSYYHELISSGVKIYEYSKGFIHAKSFVSDDKVATVGTANLDYRSLYLNFECGALMVNTPGIIDMRVDFLEMLNECHEVTKSEAKSKPATRILQNLLRIIAPLM